MKVSVKYQGSLRSGTLEVGRLFGPDLYLEGPAVPPAHPPLDPHHTLLGRKGPHRHQEGQDRNPNQTGKKSRLSFVTYEHTDIKRRCAPGPSR